MKSGVWTDFDDVLKGSMYAIYMDFSFSQHGDLNDPHNTERLHEHIATQVFLESLDMRGED
jgi:hypothetical protein